MSMFLDSTAHTTKEKCLYLIGQHYTTVLWNFYLYMFVNIDCNDLVSTLSKDAKDDYIADLKNQLIALNTAE